MPTAAASFAPNVTTITAGGSDIAIIEMKTGVKK
jgi:hypothetical protein